MENAVAATTDGRRPSNLSMNAAWLLDQSGRAGCTHPGCQLTGRITSLLHLFVLHDEHLTLVAQLRFMPLLFDTDVQFIF
jgi:hypothetical protein